MEKTLKCRVVLVQYHQMFCWVQTIFLKALTQKYIRYFDKKKHYLIKYPEIEHYRKTDELRVHLSSQNKFSRISIIATE